MTALIDEMHNSVVYWLGAAYRQNRPEIAQDESPASILRSIMRKLARRWLKRFSAAAQDLGDYFAKATSERSDAALKAVLKKAGFTVDWKMTAAQNDIVQATIGAQVGLIKSIPEQYLKNVEGIVLRGVQTGRDIGQITKDLQEQYGVSKRRAAFIARDQSNKSTAAMTRARQIELGITQAEWVHSGGGRHPRPEHVKAGRDKLRYDVTKGAYLEGVWTWPGHEINCRCVARSVIPALS